MNKIVLVLTVFGLLTVFVASATTFWLRTSLPITNGLITLDGLTAPVTVTRDVYGIPHIKGESQTDVYFGLGFVHAQDRMW
ncbi:MAG: penicillin acylase family protein, partial [Alphaproteobacteria bacterium]